ncbi:ABC transporter permease [Lachnospiraceae bacterium C1.1]|nr:ABC transporter permease subunit [Lachnospiraceae bacterium C1.1]
MKNKYSLKKRKFKENIDLLLLAAPAVLWFLIFSYLPMFGIAFAFKKFTPVPGDNLFRNLFLNSKWVGLDNFTFLIRSSEMSKIILNTLLYNMIFLIAGIVIPVILAIFLTEIHNKNLSGLIQMLMLLPYFLSWVIVGYCAYGFLATNEGMLNHFLTIIGRDTVQWYQSPQYWRTILIFTGIWKSTGYAMIIYLSAITGIDRSLYESATMDGAGLMDKVRFITIPQLIPTITTIFILQIGSILTSDFGLFYQVPLDSNSLLEVTETLDVYVYKALMQQANFSFSAASSFLQSVVGCVLLMLTVLILKKVRPEE